MRICVFGAGSLGSALGGLLSRKNEVTLVGRRPHVRAVQSQGLHLIGDVRMTARVHASESLEGVDPPDVLLISTKAYDTREAIAYCRKRIPEDALALTLQNGLGNLEALREWKGVRALGGTTTLGATLTSPGIVRVSGLGKTVIGSDLNAEAARATARALNESGIPASTVSNVAQEVWSKAVVSACINPTTAVLRIPNGGLLRNPVVLKLLDSVSVECVSVARACGIRLGERALQARVRAVARNTRKNTSSMLQDILHGKRTEIAQINGAFYLLGKTHGISCPFNRVLTSMVEALEAHTRKQKS